MTTITDAEAQRLTPAQRLGQRWDETEPADTRPMAAGAFIEWRAPTLAQRIRNAVRAAWRELRRAG